MQLSQEKLPVSIVIPARNEAKNLYHFLPSIPAGIGEIILVDGHSTDDTIAVAQSLCPDIRIIRQVGKGKGDAMRAGFAACTQDIVVMLDSDGSADPEEILRFVEALVQGCDFAKGSRFIKGGGSTDITLLRRLGNYALCGLVNLLFRERFSDLCYGYNAFRRNCLDHIVLDCTGFEIEAQLCLRVQKAGLKIVEVPSMESQRIHGQSNLRTFRDGWRILKVILHEWRNRPVRKNAIEEESEIPAYHEAERPLASSKKVSLK
jgi:glycosyltransferase involved in cell wall biosynthesis